MGQFENPRFAKFRRRFGRAGFETGATEQALNYSNIVSRLSARSLTRSVLYCDVDACIPCCETDLKRVSGPSANQSLRYSAYVTSFSIQGPARRRADDANAFT